LRLLCDADVDAPLVQHLRDAGHEVQYMAEIQPRAEDDQVLELATQQAAILVTRDKGFGQMVFRQGFPFHGVLLIRLAGIPMAERKQLLTQAFRSHGHQFEGAFSVLTRNGLRVRPRFPGRGPSE
jgi:predicted nuclease of predicted toxin-antitoxin system